MYLLDTNHLSQLIERNPKLLQRLAQIGRGAEGATCVIVRGELIFMATNSARPEENIAQIEQFLTRIPVYEIDDATADWYGTLKAHLMAHFGPKEKAKRRRTTLAQIGITDNDLWIAACAKRHGAILVSADSDFERIQAVTELEVESWL